MISAAQKSERKEEDERLFLYMGSYGNAQLGFVVVNANAVQAVLPWVTGTAAALDKPND